MKLPIDLPSALVGGSLLAAVVIVLGAQSPGSQSPLVYEHPKVIEHVVKVKGIPSPEEVWSIYEFSGDSIPSQEFKVVYTVPHNKWLVINQGFSLMDHITRVWEGMGGNPTTPKLRLPGQQVDESWFGAGFAFAPGTDVMLENEHPQFADTPTFTLMGYLADAE